MNAVQEVTPPFRPKCQYRHDNNYLNQRDGHLHDAELWRVFCHTPAGYKSHPNEKPSESESEHDD
jgi:hypothetical protein